ncbi:MAG: carbohydrate ABC transporter permease, partial [Hungatella hathewayi]
PGVVIIIPLYSVFTKLGLLDTHFSMIVADMALTIPMGVIMLSSFFEGVPKELEEAAKIDGTTGFGALFLVVMPIAKPGLISVAIYTFINAWEEFLFAMNLSMSTKTRTLPIAINAFAGEFAVDWGATMAAAALVALPVLALFLLCNRYFVQGLSDGAVKG